MADDSTSSSTPSFPKLCSSNYSTWKGEMKAFLHTKSLWTIAKWDIRADKAAGQLYLLLSAKQRTHINAVQDDPAQIWSTLETIHLQQRPGARFNAWDDFFSIRKKQDESLTSLIARIEDSMSKIQQLRPKDASTPYTIKDLDNELICIAMVRSLGDEYSHFASSLLLFQSLEKDRLKEAFLAEELQRMRRPELTSGSEAVLFASGSNCKCPPSVSCSFCEYSNHCIHKCQNLVKAKSNYLSQKSKHTKKGGNSANQASDASSSSQPPAEWSSGSQSASQAMEFAGNASLCSLDLSSPLYPLQLDADVHWVADTGATAHMTPHRHWMRNYTPKCVPVKLADNKVIYSAGVGSVVFVLVIG
ncbi:hypothetical protein SCLCIDRAFT_21727 [Scleroderma citrinum Foug A]|uniref:Retrovirus-related Pol polyprotein from transposon TNT 1-94-like beta-barrel domain-containing protein n=1 Tax=Scleroderma citrinum Foug A TaxID=1036808 RepID=A0A0C2ZYU6_9AGAM|nr:hypothetical protein SCLCIDRAFT_21727 [Scleroderma citrinum Foug A]